MEVMIATLVIAPVLLIGLMRFGEGETHQWLAEDSEGSPLARGAGRHSPADASGQRIKAPAARLRPEQAALVRDYCIAKAELVLAAEEEMLDRTASSRRARPSGSAPPLPG